MGEGVYKQSYMWSNASTMKNLTTTLLLLIALAGDVAMPPAGAIRGTESTTTEQTS